MRPRVRVQLPGLLEGPGAVGAVVGANARVHQLVLLQVVRALEGLRADGALEGAGALVVHRQLVLPQVGRVPEAQTTGQADRLLVPFRLLHFVDAFVVFS